MCIRDRFDSLESGTSYTLNSLLAAESINFENYSKENLEDILNQLVFVKGEKFFSQFGSDESIFGNLTDNDYQKWITSDRVTLFKVKLALASLTKDDEALSLVKEEALNYCTKPWSEPYKDQIKRLCLSV